MRKRPAVPLYERAAMITLCLGLVALVALGMAIAQGYRTCSYARASHHTAGTVSFSQCVVWETFNNEDDDSK